MKPLALHHRAIILAALAACSLWYFSRELLGHAEAWDGKDGRYLLCMLGIGVFTQLLFPARARIIYFATAIGALVGAAFALGTEKLNPMGGVLVFAYALPALGGAWAVQRLRRR